MKLSLAIQTPEVEKAVPVALLSGTLEEKLRRAAQLGAQGVELMTADPQAMDWQVVAGLLHQNGLEAAAVASGAILFSLGLALLHSDQEKAAQAKNRLYSLIDFAAALGAPLVTIGSFRGRSAWVDGDGKARLAAILREAGEAAMARSVRLVLEPLNRYEADLINTAEQGLDFLQMVHHPAVGLLLDTFHVNIEETSWTEPFIRLMAAGKLWHVHLGDNNRLPPGFGLIDFPSIVTTLYELGYDGYLSAELLAKPDPDTAAVQTLAYMRTLVR
jgi:sugar phosphate isomerase/epimerase